MLQLLDQALDLVQQRLDLGGGAPHGGAGRAVDPVALSGDGGSAGVEDGLQGQFGLVPGEGGVLRPGNGRRGVGQCERGGRYPRVGEMADLGEQGAGSALGLLEALLAAGEPVLCVAVALLAAGQAALGVQVVLVALRETGLGGLRTQLAAGQARLGVLGADGDPPAGACQDTGCHHCGSADGRRGEQLDLRHRSPRSNGGIRPPPARRGEPGGGRRRGTGGTRNGAEGGAVCGAGYPGAGGAGRWIRPAAACPPRPDGAGRG